MSEMSISTRLKNLFVRVGLDFVALGLLTTVFLILVLIYGGEIRASDGSVIWPTLVLVTIVTFRVAVQLRRVGLSDPASLRGVLLDAIRVIRDWAPLILLILVYENLRALTGRIRPDSIDMKLYAADLALFGVEPTIWIQRFVNPWLTDYFAFAYMLYFVLPLVLGTIFYLSGRRHEFREMMVGIILVEYVGFVLYLFFPAGPPRYAISELYNPQTLTGALGLFESTQGVYDRLNPVRFHSSFPSLHCALSLTGLLYAWHFRRLRGGRMLFWVFVPLVVSLWISTVYLRHHWLVDCFAGFALSLCLFPVTGWMKRHLALFGGEAGGEAGGRAGERADLRAKVPVPVTVAVAEAPAVEQ